MDKKLTLLMQASAAVAKERSLNNILLRLMEVTKALLEADRCSIFLHDKDQKELWTIIADGVKEIRVPEDKGIVGQVYLKRAVLNIPDAYNDPRFDKDVDKATGYHTKSILAFPLVNTEDVVLGVFQVINKLDNQLFNEDDITLLQHLSLYVASNVENHLLQRKLKKSSEDVIYRLSYATKFKDPETQYHIIRVGLYSEELARHLGWNDEDLDNIRLATPMHDIGKVGIPDNVLQKPGALDNNEFAIMKKHAQYGYDILKGGNNKLMDIAAIAALDHHEKWNGKGYPNGKKKEEISIPGRLTAIADVFDALTSKRCYKEAWSYDRTFALIKEERGEHFDPGLVDIFFEHSDKIIAIKEQYKDDVD